MQWHPHGHLLVTDGAFSDSGAFHPIASWDAEAVMTLFRERLLARLLERHAISEDLARRLLSWRHPGFSAHVGNAIPFEDKKAIEDVACYLVRAPLSLKKLVYLDDQKAVLYRSKRNPFLGRNFEAMDPREWRARLAEHIPDAGKHRTHFYAYYANRVRGQRSPEATTPMQLVSHAKTFKHPGGRLPARSTFLQALPRGHACCLRPRPSDGQAPMTPVTEGASEGDQMREPIATADVRRQAVRPTCHGLVLRGVAALAMCLGPASLPAEAATEAAWSPKVNGQVSLPMYFEANQGQTDARVRFLARGPGYGLLLTQTEATLVLGSQRAHRQGTPGSGAEARPSEVVRMRFERANTAPEVVGRDRLPGHANYYSGNDRSAWRTGIPTYARVEYHAVYPGIDLVYRGTEGHLEYDFVIAAGADPGAIAMAFEGLDGLRLESGGALTLRTAGGELSLEPPHVYQERDGVRRSVPSRYVLRPGRGEGRTGASEAVGVQVEAYDRTRPLVIDPVLVYSSYLGGSDREDAKGVAVDSTGHVYVAGSIRSLDFPTPGLFVAKLTPDGSALVYTTFLGPAEPGRTDSIAVDCQGYAYVAGDTDSRNFPTLNAIQPALAGGFDAVVAKLDPTGALVYSTYLGGRNNDGDANVEAGCDGSTYVAGQTSSPDFPTANPIQQRLAGGFDAFVAKITPDGSALVYSTFLGGSQSDAMLGFAVDSAGSAYVTGSTISIDFPTVNALQSRSAGLDDIFVAQLTPDGSALVYSTYLGGRGDDEGWGLTVDLAGNAYVTGRTESFDFPTVNAFQPTFGGGFDDAFVAKIGAGGSPLVYSSFLGGSDEERGWDISVGSAGNAYVTGFTQSPDFPTVNAIDGSLGNTIQKAFVTKVAADGTALIYSTYFRAYQAWAIAVDSLGTAWIVGETFGDLPLRRPLQAVYGGGGQDAFVARINAESLCGGREATILGTSGSDQVFGSPGRDVIVGLEGDDVIFGLGGNDLICAGPGNDVVFGGGGDDVLLGEGGNDTLVGGPGVDYCYGGANTDAAFGCEATGGIP